MVRNKPATYRDRLIAYFSMEVALDARMPTYSGGLGVLAGDIIKAAAVTFLFKCAFIEKIFRTFIEKSYSLKPRIFAAERL